MTNDATSGVRYAVADAINRARYRTPDPGLPECALDDEDRRSQEYAYRLADAAISAMSPSPAPAGEAKFEGNYVDRTPPPAIVTWQQAPAPAPAPAGTAELSISGNEGPYAIAAHGDDMIMRMLNAAITENIRNRTALSHLSAENERLTREAGIGHGNADDVYRKLQAAEARATALEAALKNLLATVKAMKNPQTIADVGLLLLKFAPVISESEAAIRKEPTP